jgi:hypothetical protein
MNHCCAQARLMVARHQFVRLLREIQHDRAGLRESGLAAGTIGIDHRRDLPGRIDLQVIRRLLFASLEVNLGGLIGNAAFFQHDRGALAVAGGISIEFDHCDVLRGRPTLPIRALF